ncbi:MAG: hypothetical protein KTR31_19045 [Myxococcales bacterium]|nr:hypothetical protein [Myxococcales bacterium]
MRWVIAIGLTIVTVVLREGIDHALLEASIRTMPTVSNVLWVASPICGLFALPVWAGVLGRRWLWLAVLCLPLALVALALSPHISAIGPLAELLLPMANDLLWMIPIAAAAFWWADGPSHAPLSLLLDYVPSLVIWWHVILVGSQFLLPGLAALALCGLLPVVAARQDRGAHWVMESVRDIGRRPAAWGAALLGSIVASGAVFVVAAAVALVIGMDVLEVVVGLVMSPAALPLSVHLSSDLVSELIWGATWAVAAVLYDRGDPRRAEGRALAPEHVAANPYASEGASP